MGPSRIEDGGTSLGETGSLTLDSEEIAVYHGTSVELVDMLVDCGTYDHVAHGIPTS